LPRQTPFRATLLGSGWMSVSPPMKSMPMLLTSRTTLLVTAKPSTLPFSVSASLGAGSQSKISLPSMTRSEMGWASVA
jgi:hypothetical protein